MQTATIFIVFHSRHGHTEQAAKLLAGFLQDGFVTVHVISAGDTKAMWQTLHASDAIVFGCPTLFGNVSAQFKTFMEETEGFLYKQLWKNKLAAAFTVSPSAGGDKLLTLHTIAEFAAQHGMLWVSLGVLPRYCSDQQTEGQNRFSSYMGLMIQSDNSDKEVKPFHTGDVLTTELFAKRILDVILQFKNLKINNHDTVRN